MRWIFAILALVFSGLASPRANTHPRLHQSRTLATLRGTLLPELLSGGLSVAEFTVKMPSVS